MHLRQTLMGSCLCVNAHIKKRNVTATKQKAKNKTKQTKKENKLRRACILAYLNSYVVSCVDVYMINLKRLVLNYLWL